MRLGNDAGDALANELVRSGPELSPATKSRILDQTLAGMSAPEPDHQPLAPVG
jgi:hypothetical protein